jgi:alkylation response protein AidB-like acyl-CoA dehydrogenase
MSIERFRSEVRRILEEEVPARLRGKASDAKAHVWGGKRPVFEHPESRAWLEIAVSRGWTAPRWPREYGGGGLSTEEAGVLESEIARLDLPAPLVGFGLSMIGPTLLQFGSEELKREHLPKIVRGEIRWCQGYSEPNAGSDLASLQTSAVQDGDHFVVNGQKIWTSYGDLSDWMFLLVRTDPGAKKKQTGITFLLLDLATPGVLVRPILLISGASPFCETFFTDVRIPRRNMVSELNAGWTVAKGLLGHERAMLASLFGTGGRRSPASEVDAGNSRLVDLARKHLGEQDGRVADPLVRDDLTRLAMDELALQLTIQRAVEGAQAGRPPGPETSLFKIYGTELNQRREELMLAIRGPRSLGWEGAGFAAEDLEQTRAWLRSRGNSIEGGTSEVQLNIIAKQVLALPD